jgi:hypothetical protein
MAGFVHFLKLSCLLKVQEFLGTSMLKIRHFRKRLKTLPATLPDRHYQIEQVKISSF